MHENRSSANVVIGGTGMLAGATHWLSARSSLTILAARRASRFTAGDAAFQPVDTDWNSASFHEDIARAIATAPPIERALIWLHDPASRLQPLLVMLKDARVVLVLGSADGQPAIPDQAAGIATVRLGSKETSGARRWLTHEEISRGAIAALQDGKSRIVGDLKPLR